MASEYQIKQVEMIRRHLSTPLNAGERTEAEELQIFIENDYETYKAMIEPTTKSMVKKAKKSMLNQELGILGFLHVVDYGAKRYEKTNGTEGQQIFSLKVRVYTAKSMYDDFVDEYRLGNYE